MKKTISVAGKIYCQVGISDSVADQDLTKDPSTIATVTLHFPMLVPEEQLEDISIF